MLANPVAPQAPTRTVTVTVDPDVQPPVNPEVAMVKSQTLISFQLKSDPKYIFSTQPPPIVVSGGADNFPKGPKRHSNTWVTLYDACACSGTFEYTINLIDTSTGQLVQIDPVIQNEG